MAVLVFFPIVVMTSATIHKPSYMFRIPQLLGATSYGVYVLHVPLYLVSLYMLREILELRFRDLPLWTGLSFVASVFLVAYAAYRFYDAPVRCWLTAKLMQKIWL